MKKLLSLLLALVEALYGDEAAQVRGSTVTWQATGRDLADAMGGSMEQDSTAVLDGFSLTTTLGKDGSTQLAGSWKTDLGGTELSMALQSAGTLSGGTGSFSLALSDLFALDLHIKTTIETVSTLPDLDLPAGAVVEDLAVG